MDIVGGDDSDDTILAIAAVLGKWIQYYTQEYKDDAEWKAKGIPIDDIQRDVTIVMPSLDLFGETK